VVQVVSAENQPLGLAHYNAHSQIVARLFHFGADTPATDAAYWAAKVQAAYKYRQAVLPLAGDQLTGYRLVNAEGDHLPGVIIDRYGDTAVLQLRTPGTALLADSLRDALLQLPGIKYVYDKSTPTDDDEANPTGGWLTAPAHQVMFTEHGLRFEVRLEAGQKTGYYLDQRENRHLVGHYAKGRRVLDAFTYAGGFGTHALAGGAAQVVSVDASEGAIENCKANVGLNFTDPPHTAIVADCFEYLRKLTPSTFDLIVLDPPAFTKHISTVKRAARGYKDINLLAFKNIAPGGLLFTFSCSQHISADLFRKIVFSAAADAGRPVRLLHQLGQPTDHPVDLYHPEGEYLKGLVVHVL
jgi:23S rRNA (cytosine1962-C5)-methyltransferase